MGFCGIEGSCHLVIRGVRLWDKVELGRTERKTGIRRISKWAQLFTYRGARAGAGAGHYLLSVQGHANGNNLLGGLESGDLRDGSLRIAQLWASLFEKAVQLRRSLIREQHQK